jgi:hypothetical protein
MKSEEDAIKALRKEANDAMERLLNAMEKGPIGFMGMRGVGTGDGWLMKPQEEPTNYGRLDDVLAAAKDQAAGGKGKERHADDQPFEAQPIQWIEEHFKSFQLGQAVKKMHESQRLPKDAAINELLGAINYLAARVIFLQDHKTS